MQQKWSSMSYTHISLSTDNLVLSVYYAKVEKNREKEREREKLTGICIELQSFSLSLFLFSSLVFLYVNIIYHDVPFANSLSIFSLCVLSFL